MKNRIMLYRLAALHGRVRSLSFVAIAVIFAVFAATPSHAELSGDITLGGLNPLSGGLSSWGAQTSLAMEVGVIDFNAYLEETNAGWQVVLADADSHTNPQIALEQIQSYRAHGINLVLGPLYSGNIKHVMGYTESNSMLLLSCCSATAELAIPGDRIFRLYPDVIKQGTALGHILHHEGVEVVVPIYRADPYGDGVWRAMADTFTAHGGVVDEGVRYAETTAEFSAEVWNLAQRVQRNLDAHGDKTVAVMIVSFDEGLQIFQSASSYDTLSKVRWFGDESLTKNSMLTNDRIASEFLNNVDYVSIQMAESFNAQHNRVEEFSKKRLGTSPATFTYAAYDTVWILGLSIQEAGTTDALSVAEVLPAVANGYSGAMGDVQLDVAGDITPRDYTLWTVRDGQWERVAKYIHDANVVVPVLPHNVTLTTVADITGDLSVLGREALAGMALAVEDFGMHQQETSAGWRLHLGIMDSETDPQIHRDIMRDVDADIILSCSASNSLAGSLDYIRQRGLAVVSACSSSAELALPGDGLFRLYPDDDNIIDLLTLALGDGPVVMVVRNDSWGNTQSAQLSTRLQDYTIVPYEPGTADFDAVIGGVLDAVDSYGASDTDIMVMGFAESADILAAAAGHNVLYDARWLGSNGNARHPDIVANAASATFAEAVAFSAPMNADATIPARLQADASYPGTVAMTDAAQTALRLEEYISSRVPIAYAAGPVAYDALWITALTLDRIGSLNPEAFREAFADVAASYSGVTGSVTLNEAGDLSEAIYDTWVVQNGQWEFQSRYDGNLGIILSVEDMRRQSVAVLMVESAIADFGADMGSAISAIHDPGNAAFRDGDMHVFVVDGAGNVLAHGEDQNLVGTDYGAVYGTDGESVGDVIAGAATPLGAWVALYQANPATSEDALKMLWVKSLGDLVFGSGFYIPIS